MLSALSRLKWLKLPYHWMLGFTFAMGLSNHFSLEWRLEGWPNNFLTCFFYAKLFMNGNRKSRFGGRWRGGRSVNTLWPFTICEFRGPSCWTCHGIRRQGTNLIQGPEVLTLSGNISNMREAGREDSLDKYEYTVYSAMGGRLQEPSLSKPQL